MLKKVQVVPYDPSLKSYFRSLNVEWLDHYYSVTQEDLDILDHPEKIIATGGSVFFAKTADGVLGTCALLKGDHDDFELIKMGVSPDARNMGIGSLLMEACISDAKRKNAKLITLETAVPLKAAIHLYKKYGFVQTSEEYTHPVFKRTTFKMELVL